MVERFLEASPTHIKKKTSSPPDGQSTDEQARGHGLMVQWMLRTKPKPTRQKWHKFQQLLPVWSELLDAPLLFLNYYDQKVSRVGLLYIVSLRKCCGAISYAKLPSPYLPCSTSISLPSCSFTPFCVYSELFLLYIIGASLSEHLNGRKASPANYVSIYLSMYVSYVFP